MIWLLLACTEPEPEWVKEEPLPVLHFSAIPDQNTTLLQQKFEPVAEYLSNTLGVPVVYVPAADYSASVEMFKNGDIELAWFGGLTGVQARAAVPGSKAVVQGAEDPKYYSYFIANTESGLEPGPDFPMGVASTSFAFGSESSTSGRLMPEYFIRQASGESPKEFFEKPFAFSGAHDKTAKMVESGAVQAGVLSYTTWDRMVAEGGLDPSKVQVIWKTPEYADYNFSLRPGLDAQFGVGFETKLQASLLAMEDPVLLRAFARSALIPAKNEDFARIEEVARELDMLR
ncbi:MAG: phosphonate transport system substrate-binding protein [Cognaticolwellia sp.]|jgi:phosphonate transport system substrate-binding protein